MTCRFIFRRAHRHQNLSLSSVCIAVSSPLHTVATMHLSLIVTFLALAHSTLAQYNASTMCVPAPSHSPSPLTFYRTNSDQLNAAVSAIAASYFPSSILPSLAVAIGSASITGDPHLLLSNLATESTPPAFLSALPTPYQTRLAHAESRISSLRAAVDSLTAPPTSTPITINGTVVTGNITLVRVNATAIDNSTFPTTVPAEIINGTTITSGVVGGTFGVTPTSSGGVSSYPFLFLFFCYSICRCGGGAAWGIFDRNQKPRFSGDLRCDAMSWVPERTTADFSNSRLCLPEPPGRRHLRARVRRAAALRCRPRFRSRLLGFWGCWVCWPRCRSAPLDRKIKLWKSEEPGGAGCM